MAGGPSSRWGTRSAPSREEPIIGGANGERFATMLPPEPPRSRARMSASEPVIGSDLFTLPGRPGSQPRRPAAAEPMIGGEGSGTPSSSRSQQRTARIEPGIAPVEPVYAAPDRTLPGQGGGQRPALPSNPLLSPKVLVPALLVILVLGAAMGFTPGGGGGKGESAHDALALAAGSSSPTSAATQATVSQTAQPSSTAKASVSPVPANLTVNAVATQQAQNGTGATNGTSIAPGHEDQVAGVQSTPTQAVAYAPTSCGQLKETATSVSVEQAVNGVSVRATQAAVYPIDYLSCILVATGSKDSLAIAQSLDKASRDGATHGVVIDLWVANSNKDFGQVNLKSAIVAAAGQVFSPLATLNGRAEVVVTGGQGRSVSIVVAMTNTITDTTGPMTLQIDAPLIGGKPMQGKYTLFLPTP